MMRSFFFKRRKRIDASRRKGDVDEVSSLCIPRRSLDEKYNKGPPTTVRK